MGTRERYVVRLPPELIQAMKHQIIEEKRRPHEVIEEALHDYLNKPKVEGVK